ncbi:G-type lectin S-receptor-like serine/threonine-protein kinase [Citrus sinensis]|uniref:G-type lectin S-receptor-like serine/threonine-protein kinase n=1 Tax=Citrus sinensis TaxID=2711 RepID=A0ACB8NXY8_CITSI|nr:G-type lectin S-receptor-like serine/threonine-protein kinase [Citrus sinensis]KAH9803043.1 G-type lectin S-receptor-like serine/threonine-protein kinase [Citrus sinensis]
MIKQMEGAKMLIIYCFLFYTIRTTSTQDTLRLGQSIRDGETLVSANESFELGFFSPGKSKSRYLGIWYKKIANGTVTWVANRNAPLPDRSGVLSISSQGNGTLILQNSTNGIVWSSNASRTAQNPVAVLLESGNLVVKSGNDNDSDNFLWQSFDYPTHVLLPGMKLGVNLVTGLNRFISSWKSADDPAQDDYMYEIDPRGVPQAMLLKGSTIRYRPGSWNGLHWTGMPQLQPNPVYTFEYVSNEKEVFYRFTLIKSSVPSMMVVSPLGESQRYTWMEQTQKWAPFLSFSGLIDQCDNYALCGTYAICKMNSNSAECECLEGFEPKSPRDWKLLDKTDGCVRRTKLDCERGDGFLKRESVKLPDTRFSRVDKNISLFECKELCSKNCSCTAYANADVRGGGSGCLLWFHELTDMKILSEGGQDLYIRMATSELGNNDGRTELGYNDRGNRKEEMELPIFDWKSIANATDNFSEENKLGEGGFGPVYKGMLIDGQEIAVKRLSKSSGQGVEEFKNEVLLIAKLQHRNLVKLLDGTRRKLLDWSKRCQIIGGIARGLLYLHQDSRLRIIHRDLKASNVLLDNEMNPKISDFGMARAFGVDQTEANTNRVVGTYGYMPPEYAIDGLFSVKSDVFSFGVLAWRLWTEDRPVELIDKSLEDTYSLSEALRCIQVGLLCVQQRPEDRPNMASVVLMLSGERSLPQPKQPGFFTERNLPESESSSSNQTFHSSNQITVSLIEGR